MRAKLDTVGQPIKISEAAMAFERLSSHDDSLVSSYAEHIQRYNFALKFCEGKRVLDAGCGIGYGSQYLAANGAKFVLALDISEEALREARQKFAHQNLIFEQMDVERIGDNPKLNGQFDIIVNFENLEHLHNPQRLVAGAESILQSGVLITSTPNGAISKVDESGNPSNKFHVKEFTAQELADILRAKFATVTLYGQWLTPAGKLRKLRARELFDQLNESYYNPMNRCGRIIKRLVGKRSLGPPKFTAEADSFYEDYVIQPINEITFPWQPTTLIAICEK
jgi:2-polyprenyl-3-methyl-5-hydroxy-6-metoxy-1,4-benzoquinol methylase